MTSAVVDYPPSYDTLVRILNVDVFTANAGYRGFTLGNLWDGDPSAGLLTERILKLLSSVSQNSTSFVFLMKRIFWFQNTLETLWKAPPHWRTRISWGTRPSNRSIEKIV